MGVIGAVSFEWNDTYAEGHSFTGTASNSTTQARTGSRSIRCNPSSGASGAVDCSTYFSGSKAGWWHFGLYLVTAPSVTRQLVGLSASGGANLKITSSGTIQYLLGSTVYATSAALSTNTWYWISFESGNSALTNTSDFFRVNNATVTRSSDPGASFATLGIPTFGFPSSEASAAECYIDDIMQDDAGFIGNGKVGLALPISDNSIGAGWTLGTGTAISSNGYDAVNNTPPVGVADLTAGSDTKQIRNAGKNTDAAAFNLTTYTNLGVGSGDTVLAVESLVSTGAPVTTGAKTGSLTISNPTVAKTSFGNFYQGSNAGTYSTGWTRYRSLTTSPTVTKGNSPVLTVTQDTSSTRIAMVCAVGLTVVWSVPASSTPAVQNTQTRYKLWATSVKNAASRYRIFVRAWKNAQTRYSIVVRAFGNAQTRYRLWATAVKNTQTRYAIFDRAWANTQTRYRLIAQSFQNAQTRYRISVATVQNAATRYVLWAQSFANAQIRYVLWANAWANAQTRYRLFVAGFQNAQTRYIIAAVNGAFANAQTRYRLIASSVQNAATRYLLIVAAFANAQTRYALVAAAIQNAQTRYQLIASTVVNAATRYVIIVGGGTAFQNAQTRYVFVARNIWEGSGSPIPWPATADPRVGNQEIAAMLAVTLRGRMGKMGRAAAMTLGAAIRQKRQRDAGE